MPVKTDTMIPATTPESARQYYHKIHKKGSATMKKLNLVLVAAALIAGLVIGYRATMLNAQIIVEDERTVAVTVWGRTDLYDLEVRA